MYVDLVARQKELKLKLVTAEIAVTGGAPCSPQLFRDIKRVLDLRCVKVSYEAIVPIQKKNNIF